MRSAILKLGLYATVILSSAAPACAATKDSQLWTSIVVSGRISETVLVSGDVVSRYADDVGRLGQLVLRGQIGTPLSKTVTAWVGYAHAITYARSGPKAIEERSFEQVNWALGTIGTARLSSRTRLEQRFLHGIDAPAWRLREQLRLVVPLRVRGPSAIAWVEPMVSLNATTGVRSGIDQVRGFAGVGFPLDKHFDVEAGYLHQYVNRAAGDRSNHALSVSLIARL